MEKKKAQISLEEIGKYLIYIAILGVSALAIYYLIKKF
jgi:hypothetical protein